MSKFITKFEENSVKWYTDIILKADLVEYSTVKGLMTLKPFGFKLWTNIKNLLNGYFDEKGVDELYLPLLIPLKELKKEAEHIKGFAPEVFTVTKIGNKEVEPLVIRPTSEILFTNYFKNNVTSYNQLPIKLNQWVNIMRGEKNTRPFLRTSEFLWQEGHTLHSGEYEALNFTKEIFKLYSDFFKQHLDLYVLAGKKTEKEKFAGALATYTIETILKDGKALQSGTSHYLGNTFTKSFNVKIQGNQQKEFYPYQTSWGVSTRMIGAIALSLSDNEGLRLPWDISPYNVVILTHNPKQESKVSELAKKINSQLKYLGYKTYLDDSEKSIGFKSANWEIKGIPLRIEIGSRDLQNNQITIVKRHTNIKELININELNIQYIENFKKEYKEYLFNFSKSNTKKIIKNVESVSELKKVIESNGVGYAYWKEDLNIEEKLQQVIEGATVRLIKKVTNSGKCIHSGELVNTKAIISKAY